MGVRALLRRLSAEARDSEIREATLYVRRAMRGRGIGARLLTAIADAARGAGRHKLTAKIFTTNGASVVRFDAAAGTTSAFAAATGSSTASGAMSP